MSGFGWYKYFDKCEWKDSQAFVVSCRLLLFWCSLSSGVLNNRTSRMIIINVCPSPSMDWMIVPCVIKHHVTFLEWRSILPIIVAEYPVSKISRVRESTDSVGARPGQEMVTSQHRRQSAWPGDRPADRFTYLYITLRIRGIAARKCQRRR